MKILFLSRYITVDGDGVFSNKSGYGYMVKDIATAIVDEGHCVDLLTHTCFTDERVIDGINILPKNLKLLIENIKFHNFVQSVIYFINSKKNLKDRIKNSLFFLANGYLEKIIEENDYDIIHIHGAESFIAPFLQACKHKKKPYIITMHGLNFLRNDSGISDYEKIFEKKLIKMTSENNIPVTVVSSGILNRIKQHIPTHSYKNFVTIVNGSPIKDKSERAEDLLFRYNIKNNDKVVICVGNISERKNQLQVIEAFSLLDSDIKENTKLLIIGDDRQASLLYEEIINKNLTDRVHVCGSVPKEEMSKYYSIADVNITASIDEGFGLPIIESFIFGIPTVCFSDLDAVENIFDSKCMILVNKRNSYSLASALNKVLLKDFDKQYIRMHGEKFLISNIAKQYVRLYTEKKDNILSNFNVNKLTNH